MQISKENILIERYLVTITPVLTEQIKKILCAAGFDVKQQDYGLNTSFTLKSGEKELKFFMYNLLMEIATIDRDEKPLRFDYKLADFDYFAKKSAKLISSKLAVLFKLLGHDDVGKAVEEITDRIIVRLPYMH